MWKLIQKLFGTKNSSSGPVPSLQNLPSEFKKNSVAVQPASKNVSPLEKLVEIAKSQVGVKEVGGNNNGPQIREYQAATNLKPASWPWCAALCCWIVREWIKDPEVVNWLNLGSVSKEWWRPKTAAAFGFIQWGKDRPANVRVLSERAAPQVGDFAVFDFSHIGIIIKVNGKNFQCVEGNTNQRGTRDSDSGDGVWIKTRTPSLVRSYIRIQPSSK